MSEIIFINQQFVISNTTPEIQWQMIGGGAGQYFQNGSGGGAAGALVTRTSIGEKVYAGRTLTIVIGGGTIGGYNGQNTTIDIPVPSGIDIYGNVSGTWGTTTRTAWGGGYGATVYPTTASAGASGGGSAGGASGNDYRLTARKLSANSGDETFYGNAVINFQRSWGGTAYYNFSNPRGAGGGGAGGNGQDATSTRGGDGGLGVNSWYAGYIGAGGGGSSPGAFADQGLNPPFYSIGPGQPNTGSGGGAFGQSGGSGVVQIRYPNTYSNPASHTASSSGDDGTYKYFVFTTSGSITF
jgi:hypothetical protein